MRSVKRVENDAEFQLAYNIRVKVFVEEQNVPVEIESDEYDKIAIHVLALEDGEPVGCGRVVFFDDYAKIGRVAVLMDKRKSGFGKIVCEELLNIAVENGAKKAVLHAQCVASKFYETLGFTPEGEIFDEDGIDHIKMVKVL